MVNKKITALVSGVIMCVSGNICAINYRIVDNKSNFPIRVAFSHAFEDGGEKFCMDGTMRGGTNSPAYIVNPNESGTFVTPCHTTEVKLQALVGAGLKSYLTISFFAVKNITVTINQNGKVEVLDSNNSNIGGGILTDIETAVMPTRMDVMDVLSTAE